MKSYEGRVVVAKYAKEGEPSRLVMLGRGDNGNSERVGTRGINLYGLEEDVAGAIESMRGNPDYSEVRVARLKMEVANNAEASQMFRAREGLIVIISERGRKDDVLVGKLAGDDKKAAKDLPGSEMEMNGLEPFSKWEEVMPCIQASLMKINYDVRVATFDLKFED